MAIDVQKRDRVEMSQKERDVLGVGLFPAADKFADPAQRREHAFVVCFGRFLQPLQGGDGLGRDAIAFDICDLVRLALLDERLIIHAQRTTFGRALDR